MLVIIMLRNLLVFLFVTTSIALVGASTLLSDTDNVVDLFEKGFNEHIRTGKINTELAQALEVLKFPGLFRKHYKNSSTNRSICLVCRVGVGAIIKARRNGVSGDDLANIVVSFCTLLEIEPPDICNGTINVHKDTLVYIIDQKLELNAKRICAVLLQSAGCNDNSLGEGWHIDIPAKSSISHNFKVGERNLTKAALPLKVLQLTDIHYDPEYTVGSNANCKEPLCCQPGSKPSKPEDAARYWGDYRGCDTPWPVLIDSLDHIVTEHKNLDYVYYTGDIVDHKVWQTNIERNSESIIRVLQQFESHFGRLLVYPILGNHEPHPVNAFSASGVNGSEISTQWIFNLAAERWMRWLPEDTKQTILKGGYYTVKIPGKYRIVALNSNVCFTFNWWLFYDDKDPYDQLQWLVSVLKQAEENKEKVHILSHIPTADDTCWANWGREYSKIVDRFSDTIAAQFNGHTHKKENVVYYRDNDLENPISVAFNGGSLTTYHNVNPNYIVYDIDPITAEVQDYNLWIYDVAKANEKPELSPKWYLLYSFKEEYEIPEDRIIRPEVMANLVKEFIDNPDLLQKYFEHKYRNAAPALEEGCNEICHLENLCYMVTSYHGHTVHCEKIKELWELQKLQKLQKFHNNYMRTF